MDVAETKDVAKDHPDVMRKIEDILKTCRTEPRPQSEPEETKGESVSLNVWPERVSFVVAEFARIREDRPEFLRIRLRSAAFRDRLGARVRGPLLTPEVPTPRIPSAPALAVVQGPIAQRRLQVDAEEMIHRRQHILRRHRAIHDGAAHLVGLDEDAPPSNAAAGEHGAVRLRPVIAPRRPWSW